MQPLLEVLRFCYIKDRLGCETLFAEGADGSSIIPFCEAFAGFVADAAMVEISRFGKFQHGLELAVDVGGF